MSSKSKSRVVCVCVNKRVVDEHILVAPVG